MNAVPYLYFNGIAEEAIEFYKKAVGAKVNMLMRFKDCPDECAEMNAAVANKVMHADLSIGESTVLVSDGRCTGNVKSDGFSLSLSANTEAEADRLFAALSEGGKVGMPLAKTFFASKFGMVNDRFGVMWMVIVRP
jgi:PhnB protein